MVKAGWETTSVRGAVARAGVSGRPGDATEWGEWCPMRANRWFRTIADRAMFLCTRL
ncbi:hypothetical protein GCM10009864_06100 [Streptomyces lunalinharesii]|uniref:Uncharacterized protein n=1 Tax=Streptomyces lunalinharesii TaxID=333384 RepID=A0ABN3R973_9ACTN